MKRTKKNERNVIKDYISTGNLTAFCRDMKAMGIVTRDEIYNTVASHYTSNYIRRTMRMSIYDMTYGRIKSDLNKKYPYIKEEYTNLKKELDRMKSYRKTNYFKILMLDGNYIIWASPFYGLHDYNRGVWRRKTTENMRKMDIINNYLLK